MAVAFVSSFAHLAVEGNELFAGNERLKAVIASWEDRAARINALDFTWSGEESQKGRVDSSPLKKASTARPDVAFGYKTRLILDHKSRVLLDYEGKRWSPEKADYVESRTVTAFNGTVRIDYFPSGEKFPSAHITQQDKALKAGRHVRALPLRMAFRATDANLGVFDPKKLATSHLKGQVGAVRCDILKHGADEIWVDPARDYIPMRWYEKRGGVTLWFIDIDYIFDKRHGWIPSEWKIVSLTDAGQIIDSIPGLVTEYTINAPVADACFQIDFRPGTWVQNYITNERYIQRESGAKRVIPDGEYDGTNYETILRTDSPGQWSVSWLRIGGGLLAIVVISALLRLWRRVSGKSAQKLPTA